MKTTISATYFVCAVAFAGLGATSVAVAKSAENPVHLLDALERCQAIADAADRLSCYDRGFHELQAARMRDKNLFVSLPQHAPFVTINSSLEGVTEIAPNTWLLVLSDRSVWRTDDDVRFIPTPGLPIKVVKATLGSFMASIGKEPAIRVIRRR